MNVVLYRKKVFQSREFCLRVRPGNRCLAISSPLVMNPNPFLHPRNMTDLFGIMGLDAHLVRVPDICSVTQGRSRDTQPQVYPINIVTKTEMIPES